VRERGEREGGEREREREREFKQVRERKRERKFKQVREGKKKKKRFFTPFQSPHFSIHQFSFLLQRETTH
jgi:hypothetical protein